MAPVMMTVDLMAGGMGAGMMVRERMDAARNLTEKHRKVSQTLEQVEGAIEGVQEDRQTKAVLQAIRDSLRKIADIVVELDSLAQGPEYSGPLSSILRCACLLAQGHDVLVLEKELESVNEEVRQQLQELVKATQLHSYASRSSGVLRGEHTRKFWDTHFASQREVGLMQLGEALKFEAEQQAMGIDWDRLWGTCRRLLLKNKDGDDTTPISVLRFGEVFGTVSLSETLKRLNERASAPTQLVRIKIFRMPGANPDRSVDLGAILVRTTDSLAIFRSLLKEHASSPEEEFSEDEDEASSLLSGEGSMARTRDLDQSLQFVRDGKFVFFLDNCTVRVRRRQERDMGGLEYLSNCCIVRSTDLPQSSGVGTGSDRGAGSRASSEMAPSEADRDEQVDFSLLAMEDMLKAEAEGLSLERVLNEPQLLQKLKEQANRSGLGEDSVALFDHERQLRNALSTAAPSGSGFSSARLRRARVGARAIAERFFEESSTYRLPLSAAEVASVFSRWKEADEACVRSGGLGAEEGLLSSFAPALEKVRSALEPLLGKLATGMVARGRVKVARGKRGGKPRVVIVGGGYAGCCAAKILDSDERFHVTLVDPKEYFEDATAMPKAIVKPGSSPQDKEGRWSRSVAKYKGGTILNGSIVYGLCTGVTSTHVEVGAFRRVVPFDFCILSTGSSYTSSIKTQNPSFSFRWRQMAQECAILSKCRQIIVVGAGLTGCEFSADIAENFPEASVILVQRNAKVLPKISGAHDKVVPVLEALGIRVMTGCNVQNIDHLACTLELSNGAVLNADKILDCTGATPNTNFMRDPSSDVRARQAVDARGFINVTNTLRVEGLENVYACGDILSGGGGRFFDTMGVPGGPVERRAAMAMYHGYVAGMNVIRSSEGGGEASLLRYDEWLNGFGGAGASAFISLGAKRGLAKVPHKKLPMYKAMGFDLFHQEDVLERDGCAIDEGIQAMKDGVTAMVLGCATSSEFLQGMMPVFGNLPQIIDPNTNPDRYLESVTAEAPYDNSISASSSREGGDIGKTVSFSNTVASEPHDAQPGRSLSVPTEPASVHLPSSKGGGESGAEPGRGGSTSADSIVGGGAALAPAVTLEAASITPAFLDDLREQAREMQSEFWTLREKHTEMEAELAMERKESELARADLASALNEMNSVRAELAEVKSSLSSPRVAPPSAGLPYLETRTQPPHPAWASSSEAGGGGSFAARSGPASVRSEADTRRTARPTLSSGSASLGDTVLAAANFISMLATQVKNSEGRHTETLNMLSEAATELPGQMPVSHPTP